MTSSYLRQSLPSTADLPCSDDTPVDNEDQNLLPNLLLLLLNSLWAERMDWFFAVDMAVYHTTGVNPRVPVVPDAFLSLGVERKKNGKSRPSYAVWEEGETVPLFALEMVSHKPGGEYDRKMEIYSKLGVLYYIVYNPEFWQRDRHQPFEVYKLEAETYRLQLGEPYWMPEIGLGIGRYLGEVGGIAQEMLAWYGEDGSRHLDRGERSQLHLQEERQQRERSQRKLQEERQQREKLETFLRSQGFDPDNLPES